MEKIAVFVNDAEYARHLLQPMLQGEGPTHWVLVGCAPTLSRHIGRWVSQAARQQWRVAREHDGVAEALLGVQQDGFARERGFAEPQRTPQILAGAGAGAGTTPGMSPGCTA